MKPTTSEPSLVQQYMEKKNPKQDWLPKVNSNKVSKIGIYN